MFGRIEKELRKKDTIIIIDPQEYVDIVSKYGDVKLLGKDVPAKRLTLQENKHSIVNKR